MHHTTGVERARDSVFTGLSLTVYLGGLPVREGGMKEPDHEA